MDNRAGEMSVFVRVVEAGSFSDAARQLHMTPSTVSKLVARIEQRLGTRLIDRSTRRLSLTEAGRLYYERSSQFLVQLDEIEGLLARDAHAASGTVRVNASVAFGGRLIEPLLPAFWRDYPGIVVDLSLSDEIADLYLDRTDVAFRIGALTDSTLTARKIGTACRKIVAAPDYLARHGTPANLDDLVRHNCLSFNFRRAAPVWPVSQGGRIADRMAHGTLLANNGETVRRLALAGAGIARLADFHVAQDIANGRLVEILADRGRDTEDIHALHLGGAHVPQRIRLFLDFMVPRLRAAVEGGHGAVPPDAPV
ncbi:transcriptional regulator, LysR family [Pseudoxanthobacter soli DSM 19599]|uniref:Transcriptional regulator, LysR family n=1 Tax=Pseudoxanthobacter soli DSM 19599 TaxID=1123029 RepID=A0A1M7ZQU2_9HYPH|nr:LysR family transcriptional regulator [Pseudoxanthobacter soli]SHO67278.1 transcriptional regulator, LysR family [Pseudoxanthobacter soli DSM 19599]